MRLLFTIIFIISTLTIVKAQTFEAISNPILVNLAPKPTNQMVKESPIPVRPIYRALIIGVSNYEHNGPRLPNLDEPVNDAKKVQEVLTKKYSFDKENITFLKNPTREDIINSLDKLANVSNEKDNVLIFYAGHGFYDEGKGFGYWLPADAKTESRSRWIANSTIKDYIGAIKSKHTLLLADACFGA